MIDYLLPLSYAIFLWWSTTIATIYLDGLPRWTFRWTMLGSTLLTIGAYYGLAVSSADTSHFGLYQAFTWGLLAWSWQELSFYLGYVTGPRRQACPEGCSGFPHFIHAVQTSLYHELAIIIAAVLAVALTWHQPNQIGTWTFLVLWWMHQSAKLNVFFGVRNVNAEYLPEHLDFLKHFFTKKSMNPLFPVSVSISTLITGWLAMRSVAADVTPFEATGYVFLATLMAVAVLEHWLLVLPLPPGAVWGAALASRTKKIQPFEVDIAAGFLGAGKTTFLRRLLGAADPTVRTVALVNDFSELGIDASLLRGRGAEVVELPNGCICCSLKSDLSSQLKNIVALWSPQRVLIEPSGVADIAALLRVLYQPDLRPLVKQLRVYTVIDASAFLRDFARLPDYFETQARLSPAFIVNKTDLVSADELQTVQDTLRALNPAAPIVSAIHGDLPREVLDGLFSRPDAQSARPGQPQHQDEHHHEQDHAHGDELGHAQGHAHGPTQRHEPWHEHEHDHDHDHEGGHPVHDHEIALGLTSWSMRLERPCNIQSLREVLKRTANGAYGEVDRLKGIARTGDGWIHFDVAGGRAAIAAFAPHGEELPRVTAIGRSIQEERLAAAIEDTLVPANASLGRPVPALNLATASAP